ncbi:MAG: 3-oxoacyl-[acyl-carrier-protein] reductase [Sedimentisphaerales bacterium]|nr:3-oxoacyl-[acyl-carrier-protein] reductase [Sedimentisphaerales bacterium]
MSEKRLAIVTGGARGIGRAIVLALARQGRRVVAMDIDEKNLAELKELAEKEGFYDDIITEKLDITDSQSLNDTIERLAEEHGGVGILVNNAGITRDGLVLTISDEDFDRVIEINLKAAFVATRAAARSMMRKRFGRIINIASVAGVMGNAGQSNYAASKAGLIGMAKTIARELAKRNVTANCVAPGFIITEMTDVLPDKVKEFAKQAIPMNKFGQVEDVANAVAFFAADESGYITGQVLCVDGGMAM